VPVSRWGPWEQQVLARTDDPQACQDVIRERQAETDDDREEMESVREAFRRQLTDVERTDPDEDHVLIPSVVAAGIVNEATGEHRPVNKAMTFLFTLGVPEIRRYRSGKRGRGCVWRGCRANAQDARMLGTCAGSTGEGIDSDTRKDTGAQRDRFW
jgi:hypothetical protein